VSAIYVLKAGMQQGPFSTGEIRDQVESEELSLDDVYWIEGNDEWSPIRDLFEVGEDAKEGEIYYEGCGARVMLGALDLPCGVLGVRDIHHVEAQVEKIKRVKPIVGAVVLGVFIVCLILIEIPRTTATHWVVWGLIILGLLIWWIRLLYAGLRAPKSFVVIDLNDGDERIVAAPAAEARKMAAAIEAVRALPHEV